MLCIIITRKTLISEKCILKFHCKQILTNYVAQTGGWNRNYDVNNSIYFIYVYEHKQKDLSVKMWISSEQPSKNKESWSNNGRHMLNTSNIPTYISPSVKPKHYKQHLLSVVDVFVGYHKIRMIMIASMLFLPLCRGCTVSIYWVMSIFALFCNSRKKTDIRVTKSRALSKYL
jgi:hypothetical protein